MRTLIAIPVYNEQDHVQGVLDRVLTFADHVLIIDDGSTDGTRDALRPFPIDVIRHGVNQGYGQSLIDAFAFARSEKYDWVITMDCDDQHEPSRIPEFFEAMRDSTDLISGSRYLSTFEADDSAPADRRAINVALTREINARFASLLGGPLTDTFCGFKAHRVSTLAGLSLNETGYAFPMQLWARAAARRLRVSELAVPLIYNDPSRGFGGTLDDPAVRLRHYRHVLHREIAAVGHMLPTAAKQNLDALDANLAVVTVPPVRAGRSAQVPAGRGASPSNEPGTLGVKAKGSRPRRAICEPSECES